MSTAPSWLTNDLIARTTRDGIWTFDDGGHVPFADGRVAALLGVAAEELLGVSLADVVHRDWRMRAAEVVSLAVAGEQSRFELCFASKQGGEVWLELTTARAGNGVGRGFVALTRDVTARVQAERARDEHAASLHLAVGRPPLEDVAPSQLVQAGRLEAVGRLAACMAHDVNNLMSVIMSSSHLVRRDVTRGSRVHEKLDVIDRATRQAGKTTQWLLDFARGSERRERAVCLEDVLSDMKPLLEALVGRGIRLTMELSDGNWLVPIDTAKTEQLLVNLTTNARRAMPEGGRLEMRTAAVQLHEPMGSVSGYTPPGDYVVLTVTDTGVGMDHEVRARSFEPFFTTHGRDGGTGLGLPACYRIVERVGGDMAVQSAPDRGTALMIYFPRAVDGTDA